PRQRSLHALPGAAERRRLLGEDFMAEQVERAVLRTRPLQTGRHSYSHDSPRNLYLRKISGRPRFLQRAFLMEQETARLALPQPCIEPVEHHQFVMRTLLDDAAAVQHNQPVECR